MAFPWRPSVRQALEQINQRLARIEQNQETLLSEMSQTQADVDAATTAIGNLTTAVSAVSADLTTAAANIQAEITALQAANPAVDTSALNAAVAGLSAPLAALQQAQAGVDALAPVPARPPAGS